MDAQGNLTSATSIDGRQPGIYEVIAGQLPAEEAIQQTPVKKNLYAIPSNINMAGLNIELVGEEGREFFLLNELWYP